MIDTLKRFATLITLGGILLLIAVAAKADEPDPCSHPHFTAVCQHGTHLP